MLWPTLVALHHDAFVIDQRVETTVDLDGHCAASDLDEFLHDELDPAPQRSSPASRAVLPPNPRARGPLAA
jgi:hypothetical protein